MKLEDAVRNVINELDPDGGGFRTTEDVDLLLVRAEAEQGAKLSPLARWLVRTGARAALDEVEMPPRPAPRGRG
jgi:hypothetical protein